jgi:hypothetical protein
MIIFLKEHPTENLVINTTSAIDGEQNQYTIKRYGSKLWYSECWQRNIRRYWLEAVDNATGEMFTCEYELVDNVIPT